MKCQALTKQYSTDIKPLLRQSGVGVRRKTFGCATQEDIQCFLRAVYMFFIM